VHRSTSSRTIALFGNFGRPVKHMRFPAQTRESPYFPASTRAIVKHSGSVLTACSTANRYGHLFPRGDDGAELAAAEQALLV
jgi:hypothetical protein